jgi:outer membrane receptor protein involved in Fe transport
MTLTRHVLPLVLGAALGGATLTSAQSQDPQTTPSDATRFKTEIVVTPERGETPKTQVPASTVVIDKAALATLPVVHASEAVAFIPGFGLMQGQFYAGRPVMSARGFFGGGEAEYVLVLVDGLPIADIESGLIDWSLVPASSIARIEAFRGPGASMYGDAAVGGVIQILTDRPANAGQLTLTGGSFNSFTGDGSYGRRSRGVSFTVSGAARRTDGAFAHSQGTQFVGAGSLEGAAGGVTWRWTGSGEARKRDDPGLLTTSALKLDPAASDPAFRFDNVDRHNLSTAFVLRRASPTWHPLARIYVRGRDENLIRTVLLAPGLGDTHARTLSSLAVGGSVEGEHSFAGSRAPVVRFGVDLAHEHLDTRYNSVSAAGVVGAENSQAIGARLRAGLFASASFEPAPRVRLTGAVRWDAVDDNGFVTPASLLPRETAWSPRGGVVVRVSDAGSVALFAQASRAFKAPTLDQMFDPRPYPDFRGGTFTISNRTLTPQRATNVEAGISGGRLVRWSALLYRMTVDNEIDFDLKSFSYANIGRSRHVGAEIEVEGAWWRRVRPSASYAFARVTDLTGADSDLQLKNVPRHLASAGIAVDLPGNLSAFARYSHTAGAYLDDANALPVDGPSTLDIRVRRPVGRHTFFLDVINATKNVYEEYGYTLTDSQGRVVSYAYAGASRAMRAGVTFSF